MDQEYGSERIHKIPYQRKIPDEYFLVQVEKRSSEVAK
jgi:hypothetical protein